MQIIPVVPRGWCQGVVRAIQIAKKTAADHPGEKITMLGMIVHNQYVVDACEELGIVFVEEVLDAEIEALIAERQEARANRDFARADQIRDELAALRRHRLRRPERLIRAGLSVRAPVLALWAKVRSHLRHGYQRRANACHGSSRAKDTKGH